MSYDLNGKRVFVAGHRGMAGSAIVRRLAREGCEILVAGREEADLTRQADVERLMQRIGAHAVVVAAARVGGIHANDTRPADFLYDNVMIEANLIEASRAAGVEKLLFLGSTCIYPKHAPQPIREDSLLSGPLEPTNEWYAIAKIAGIKLCQAYRRQHGCDYIAIQPTNLYGPGDNYDLASSHVLPALLRKAHEAKERGEKGMEVWGSGTPRREFLHVDDLADAAVHLLATYSGEEIVNVGSGEEVTIAELARLVMEVVGLEGTLTFDRGKPDGTPRKLTDTSRLRSLGWNDARDLPTGLRQTYAAFLEGEAERA